MLDRRGFLVAAGALAALPGQGAMRAVAQQRLRQNDLLRFDAKGQVTILHVADLHAQMRPLYYREPSVNIGVGAMAGVPPHLTDTEFLRAFGIQPGSPQAYALTSHDFTNLARSYGRIGGLDRLATLIESIRAERGAGNVLLLDGGDALQGSYTSLVTKGADMVQVLDALGVEATTGHWEFTLGDARIAQLFGDADVQGSCGMRFLAGNVREKDFNEPVFKARRQFEKGGLAIAVIGQAFPFTPIANPSWMMPAWSFGIREGEMRKQVAAARAGGADVVVLLSHNGFDVDRTLASRIEGIDVILTAHTHDALPRPERVGNTLLIASGSHGKFLSRLDLNVVAKRVVDFSYALIPVFADAIAPDPTIARMIAQLREAYAPMLATELARTEGTLYRRGNTAGTLDDVICDALLAERDAEIAFSPGFRWGGSLLAGDSITWEDVYNATAITYPNVYRAEFTGSMIKAILEDVADNLFNPNPYYQQGGDMVRVGGLTFELHVDQAIGARVRNIVHLRSGDPLESTKTYTVAGWASVNQNTEGPPVAALVGQYLQRKRLVGAARVPNVTLVRG